MLPLQCIQLFDYPFLYTILSVATHRENKAHMNLGRGHLFLLAQIQKQFVLQKRRGVIIAKNQKNTTISSNK